MLLFSVILLILSMLAIKMVQTSSGRVIIKELNIETDEGWTMSANMYLPKNANANNPVPAVVVSHANYSSKERIDSVHIELSRRGYAVLAIDQGGHGSSGKYYKETKKDDEVFTGVYQGVLLLSRLPYIDKNKIAVAGFGEGGLSCNDAVLKDNLNKKALISSVLLISSDAVYLVDGRYRDIYLGRDVGIVSSVYDEFAHYFWDERFDASPLYYSPQFINNNDHVNDNPNSQSFLNFGKDPSDSPFGDTDVIYRYNNRKTAALRVIYRNNIIGSLAPYSRSVIKNVINFFENSYGFPVAISANNQIWNLVQLFGILGMISLGMFIASIAVILSRTQVFEDVCISEEDYFAEKTKVRSFTGVLWYWGFLLMIGFLSTVFYQRTMAWSSSIASRVSQPQTFGIASWCLIIGLLILFMMFLWYMTYAKKKESFNLSIRGVFVYRGVLKKTIALSFIIVLLSYLWIFAAKYLFSVEFSFLSLSLKTFNHERFWGAIFPYSLMFIVFYIAVALLQNALFYNGIGGPFNIIFNSLPLAAPAVILPFMQYSYFYNTDRLLFWGYNTKYHLYTTWLPTMLIIFFGTSFISRYIYKRTKNAYLAGICNALIVTFITVANTRLY